jgi:hypothetical protein
MMLLTFSVLYDKLIDGSKTQTTRANYEYWDSAWARGVRVLDIWWRSPRVKKYNPDCYKMGIGQWTEFFVVPGKLFNQELATRDGFGSVDEYVKALAEKHNMTIADVLDMKWTIIRWKWKEGPKVVEK